MSAIRTYNVEAGLPTLDEARRLVIAEIKQAKREGVKVLKVIHGYGSSGKGGALGVGLRKSFGLRKKESRVGWTLKPLRTRPLSFTPTHHSPCISYG